MASFALVLLVAISWTQPTASETNPSPTDDGSVCSPSAANNWCAPDPATDTRVQTAVRALEENGWECSPEPALADQIVFQFKQGKRIEVLSFDEAFAAGGDGLGWSQQFCQLNDQHVVTAP